MLARICFEGLLVDFKNVIGIIKLVHRFKVESVEHSQRTLVRCLTIV